jgi:hypothetical protein
MLLINAGIFLAGMLIMLLLLKFYKSLFKEKEEKPLCDFKFSKVRYSEKGKKQIAKFSASISDKHTFFVDFPILFRFYSDNRFKGRVKISYRAAAVAQKEELVNKTIVLQTKTEECLHYLDDIIVGRIYFEVELEASFGKPIIEFEILENKNCKLDKELKLAIKFPEK